jgi:hypothetical protein
MRINNILYCLPLCLIACSCSKDIVDLTGAIHGVVKDYSDGRLIENCLVSLNPTGKSTTTNASGAFMFSGLEPGNYTASFGKAGYEQESVVVTVLAGQDVEQAILLKAKSVFSLSESIVDFGDLKTNMTIYMYNNSDSICSYEITNIPSWLALNPKTGTISGGGTEVLHLEVNKSSIGMGDYSQSIVIKYSGKASGSVSLLVSFRKQEVTTPTVVCSESAENVTSSSFDIGGTIVATGGSSITSYGHCWSKTTTPTIADDKTNLGSTKDIGFFISNVTGLLANTTYYVRSYATNAQGTTYSKQVSIRTIQEGGNPGESISVITDNASDVGDTYVTLSGSIYPGSQTIIEYGFYYGTTSNPTLRAIVGSKNYSGNYSYNLKGINEKTTYYYKAYARTQTSFIYGSLKTFATKSSPSVTFSNYRYTISYTSSNNGTPQHANDVVYDYYAEIDTHGESIIEAGFVTSYSVASCKYGGYSATSLQCEVKNNAIHFYKTEHRVGMEINSGGYSQAIRPYVIVGSGTYQGVIGFAFDDGRTDYHED